MIRRSMQGRQQRKKPNLCLFAVLKSKSPDQDFFYN
jgi:hypothetical protein